MKAIGEQWIARRRSLPGLIWWPRKTYAAMSNSDILDAIDALADSPDAFTYPIEFVKPR